ncbi:hypothetical protein ACQKP8_26665 [Photobacterium alginatilyticum]|uniref:hypothetical protein n=1 Tax=Photobacterium alginatilyticum TaxID=1775171 RepID=UPI00406984BA
MKWCLLTVLIMFTSLTGCDNHLYTQFFRNPYVVEIVELKTLESNQWYEFKTKAKAINREESIIIAFKGSNAGELDSYIRGSDENFKGGESIYLSTLFPGEEIKFELIVVDTNGIEYEFEATGQAGGVLFHSKNNSLKMGSVVQFVRIKSNLKHQDVKITWISRTGK